MFYSYILILYISYLFRFNFNYIYIYVYVLLLFFWNIKLFNNYKDSFNENDFWFLVEVLNTNNFSITFIFVLFLYYFFNKKYNTNILFNNIQIINILTILIILFLYKNSNFILNHYIFTKPIINSTLLNGVILIHPILMYYTYVIFILIIICNTYNNNFNYYNYNLFHLLSNKYNLLYSSFFSLILGGYWAQQELNWGGWWNWDFVEIIALIFNVLSLKIFHINFYKNYNHIFIFYRNIISYIICFIIFVRLDLLNSIHTFNSIQVLTNYKFIVPYFILLVCIYIYINIKKYIQKYSLIKNRIYVLSIFFKFINTIFILYFLLNLFFIINLNYQFLDFTKFIKSIILTTLYTYTIIFFKKKNFIFYFILFIFYFNYLVLLDCYIIFILFIFISFKNISNKNYFSFLCHYLFFLFILIIKFNYFQFFFENLKNCLSITYIINNNNIYNCSNIRLYENKFNTFYIVLSNYFLDSDIGGFFYIKPIYLNNIVFDNFTYVFYSLDIDTNYILYNIVYLVTLILVFFIIYFIIF